MPNQPTHTLASTEDPWDGLLIRIADQITPLFETSDTDRACAKQAALSAISAYHPESRADFVNIARILAFSVASLSALGIAATADLPPAEKMRYFGRANALNRSADQTERMMMQRRRDQRANPPAERPAGLDPQPSIPFLDDAAIDAAVQEAMTAYRAATAPHFPKNAAQPTPTAAARPVTQPAPRAVEPAISWLQAPLHAASSQPSNPPYRKSLLQRTAMPAPST